LSRRSPQRNPQFRLASKIPLTDTLGFKSVNVTMIAMKTFTVAEPQTRLSQIIADVNRGEYIVLSDGEMKVTLCPGSVFDIEQDSPELEAELLKGLEGPTKPYSREEVRGIVQCAISRVGF
jgi:hypothetical protein